LIGLFIATALTLVLVGNEPEIQYGVDEVMGSPTDYNDDELHLRGTVEIGSFDANSRSFVIVGDTHNLTIDASSIAIPPAFEEGRVVAIKGDLLEIDGEWTLTASEIITGCPSKYESDAS